MMMQCRRRSLLLAVPRPDIASALYRWQHHAHAHSGSAGSWLWPATVAAAAGLAAWLPRADAQEGQPGPSTSVQAWLTSRGVDAAAVDVAPSPDPTAGNALYATAAARRGLPAAWLGRRLGAWLLPSSCQAAPLLAVPTSLVLSVDTAMADDQLGHAYRQLLASGAASERQVVMAMLVVERCKGQASKWAPYLESLPHRYDTPLTYTEQQMQELRGTQLAAAAAALRRSTAAQWEAIGPEVAVMLRQVGAARPATYDDWLWAVGTFWSRAQSVPVAAAAAAAGDPSPADPRQQQQQQQRPAAVHVVEGVVPGLDFANHSMTPSCWWDVSDVAPRRRGKPAADDGEDAGGGTPCVRLMAERELTISYGDKGNEELLLLHGFALPANPWDTLMVPCPLPPPDAWTDDTLLRLQLLQAQGLTPQLFLSKAHLQQLDQQASSSNGGSSSSSSSSGGQAKARRGPPAAAAAAAAPADSSCLPLQARQVLQVFVMKAQELEAELLRVAARAHRGDDAVGDDSGGGGGGSGAAGGREGPAGDVSARVEALGLHMAVVTTMVRLLELQLLRLEGPEGTGSVDDDLSALQAQAAGGGAWRQACVLYRLGQKQLVRGYLRHATAELNSTMAALAAAVEEERGGPS